MRLCRFDAGTGSRYGIVEDGHVVDRVNPDERHALEDIRVLAPVLPRKFLAIGLNYADHIAESGMQAPEFPVFFNKQVTCVIGPDDDVHMPRVSTLLDYEGELAIVIGTRCRHVPEDRAHDVIAGYAITNDVSVRDWQLRTPTMTMGKSFDTHGPLGPWIVTADELGDPHRLGIKTYVNDELRQDSNTGEMIYNCFQQVAHLSEAFTLEPGDVIATGTPAGIGAVRQPFPDGLLKVGDVVRIEIEGIGALTQHGCRGTRRLHRGRGRGGAGMGALTPELRQFLDTHPVGVLATTASDGHARQSLVYFAREDERLLISTLEDRLKARDVRRTGWASLCVMGHEPPYPSAAFSGPAEILTENIAAPTSLIGQRITPSEVPSEPLTDEMLTAAGRVVLAITIERVGAPSYIPASTGPEASR